MEQKLIVTVSNFTILLWHDFNKLPGHKKWNNIWKQITNIECLAATNALENNCPGRAESVNSMLYTTQPQNNRFMSG